MEGRDQQYNAQDQHQYYESGEFQSNEEERTEHRQAPAGGDAHWSQMTSTQLGEKERKQQYSLSSNQQQQQQSVQGGERPVRGDGDYNVGGARNEEGCDVKRRKTLPTDAEKFDEKVNEKDDDDVTPIIGKKYETDALSRAVTKIPFVFAALSMLILVGLSVALMVSGVSIVADLDGFVPSSSERYKESQFIDSTAAQWRDVVDARVLANWSRNYETRGTIAGRVTAIFEVDDVRAQEHWNYLANSEKALYGYNFFEYKSAISAPTMLHVARAIAEVEKLDYYNYASCWSADRTDPYQYCTPINSLTQYYFPGDAFTGTYGETRFSYYGYSRDGTFRSQGTTKQITDAIRSNKRFTWYVDEAFETLERAQMTRIVISLGTPVQTTQGIEALPRDFATNMVMDIIAAIKRVQHPFLNVYIGGYRVFDGEVTKAANKDLKWVLLSCIFVAFATRIHMHSIFLAICCVLQTVTVFAASLFLFTAFTNDKNMPLLAVILYYVEMLMALAGQMIAFDVFKWSGRLGDRAVVILTVAQRVSLIYRHACAAITMVSIIIFSIFVVASAATSIPVVRDFANMMLIMTALNWLSLIFYFPACIIVHHYYFSHRRRNLQKQRELRLGGTQRTRIGAQLSLHAAMEQLYERYSMPPHIELCTMAKSNLDAELIARKDRVSVKQRLNLKPHFRRVGRRKANMIPPGATNPEHRHWSTPKNGGRGQMRNGESEMNEGVAELSEDEDEEMGDAFNNVDENGFVVLRDELTLPLENVIRIERANCESIGNQHPDQFVGLSSSLSNIDMVTLGETRAFRDACGITCAMPPRIANNNNINTISQGPSAFFSDAATNDSPSVDQQTPENNLASHIATKLLDVTRIMIHHIEGYGWALTLPVPTMATIANRNIREAHPPSSNMFARMRDWLDSHFMQRKRKYCFGMLGPHKEDPAARVARIKQLSTKNEGPNRIERFLGGPYLRMIVGAPHSYIFATFLLVFLAAGAIICGFLEVASTVPTFLPRSSELGTFNKLINQFGDTRDTCDYCSAYFVESTTIPIADINKCYSQLGYKTPYSLPNLCGSCTDDYSCRGCDGTTPYTSVDACRQCLPPADPRRDKCQQCAAINVGSPQYKGCYACAAGTGGPTCSSCKCGLAITTGGSCNTVTGNCDCYASSTVGYWSGSQCSLCDYGFTGAFCTVECRQGDSCGCNVFTGKCTNCPAGRMRPGNGAECLYQDPNFCDTMGGDLQLISGVRTCVCKAGYAGKACKFSDQCNGRGKVYTAAEVHSSIVGKCVCQNNFFGPQCEYCRCYNGGTCNEDGTCTCVGDWEGSDCSLCNSYCIAGGFCPVSWSPYHYDYFTCVGLFCTISDLTTVRTSSLCLQCENRTKIGCNSTSRTCTTDIYYASGRPRNACECRGYWRGTNCATCSPPYTNLYCNADGEAVGCDGQPADRNGNWKVLDRCGRCGGDGVCTGCDGLPGNKKVDKCGVCGGNNTCPSALQAAESVFLMFIFNDDHPMTSDEYRWYYSLGTDIWVSGAPLYTTESTNHAEAYVRSAGTNAFGSTTVRDYLSFVLQNRLADFVRFGYPSVTTNFNNPDRLMWAMYEYRANGFRSTSTTTRLESHYNLLKRTIDSLVAQAPPGFVKRWYVKSEAFTALGTRDAIMWDSVYIIALSSVITLGLLGVFACSVKLVIAGTCVLTTSVVCCFAVVRVLNLKYGPVEMIMVLFVMAFIASCVIYMADGYMEELHAVHSHLIAFATTRRQNVKGMLRRTGIPISLACIVLFASSMLLLGASIDVINNVGKIMSICSVLTMAFCMLGYPALLSIFGPHKIRRNKVWMVLVLFLAAIVAVIVGVALFYIRQNLMVK